MILKVFLKVKFRAFGITFGTVEKTFRFSVPGAAIIFAETLAEGLRFNERGVTLVATMES